MSQISHNQGSLASHTPKQHVLEKVLKNTGYYVGSSYKRDRRKDEELRMRAENTSSLLPFNSYDPHGCQKLNDHYTNRLREITSAK